MNALENILQESTVEFRQEITSQITPGERNISEPGGTTKVVNVRRGVDLRGQLNKVCPQEDIQLTKGVFRRHYEEMKKYISLSSSPQAFKVAWNLRSSLLTFNDLETIVSLGGQIIPMNKNSRVLRYEQQGVLYGERQRFILGVRHSEGNYDDKLDDLGQFEYQPPADVSGLLRYRFLQKIQKKIEIDLVVLAIMWFKYEINDKINHVFILAPAKLINIEADLNNLDDNLDKPLKLQIIHRSEALGKIEQIFARDESNIEIAIRSELDNNLSREFSYLQINNSAKGKKIKRWAQNTSKRCPGTVCEGVRFSELPLSQIAFGHIISQQWGRTFSYINNKLHHPDNLYLTCKNCNSQLGGSFPGRELINSILNDGYGTIGDWLRINQDDIRRTL